MWSDLSTGRCALVDPVLDYDENDDGTVTDEHGYVLGNIHNEI
jgi:hypothetical protein